MSRIRTRRLARVSGLAALLAVVAAPSALADGGFELVARATGVAGGTPLPVDAPFVEPGAITNDGRYAYFVLSVDHGAWASTQGLYRRDLVAKTSTLLVPGKAVHLTGITTDEKTISFTTTDRLSTADRNSVADVYTYSATTGAVSLVSRATGAGGTATGLGGSGTSAGSTGWVTRDGLTAIWSTTAAVMKRSLATGVTTLVPGGTGGIVGGYLETGVRPDQTSSADGSVFSIATATGATLITPARQLPWPTYATGMRITADGKQAVAADNEQSPGLAIIDTASGNVSMLDIAAAAPVGGSVAGFSPDGTKAFVWRSNYPSSTKDLTAVDLTSGVGTDQGLTVYSEGPISDNGNFALAGGGYATAATGSTLPGGIDLPSPSAYFSMQRGCRGGFLTSTTAPTITVYVNNSFVVPPITSATVTTYSGTNPKPTIRTVTATTTFKLSVGVTPYRMIVDVKLADGRTISETWSEASDTKQCELIL